MINVGIKSNTAASHTPIAKANPILTQWKNGGVPPFDRTTLRASSEDAGPLSGISIADAMRSTVAPMAPIVNG